MTVCILGIDPGLANTGIAVLAAPASRSKMLRHLDTVTTKPPVRRRRLRQADSDADRLGFILAGIAQAIDDYDPVLVVYEAPTGGRSARGVKSLAYVVGGLVALCGERQVPCLSVTPAEAKRALTGSPTASKADMIIAAKDVAPSRRWAKLRKGQLDHAADAVAVATIGLRSEIVRAVLRLKASS